MNTVKGFNIIQKMADAQNNAYSVVQQPESVRENMARKYRIP